MSVLLPILASQAFALPHSHRIDNAVSPRQNELYIIRYIDTLHVTLRCHLSVVSVRGCEVRDAQRQTFENVFLIYMTARSPTAGLTSDVAKISIIFEMAKGLRRFFTEKKKMPRCSSYSEAS